jgi:UDP-N-acetylglucosamine 2-epimerase (non-hydrolysing)
VKKLVLAGGGREAALLIAPLFDALKKNGSYDPVIALSASAGRDAVDRELALCFGLEDSCRTVELPAGTPLEGLAAAMTGMEKVLAAEQPALVIACGSDDAALGAALAASRIALPLAVVDSGLRNYERTDSREINRVLIDSIADLHFVSEHSGEYNLINEGVPDEKVFFAGNLLIDSLAGLMQQSGYRNAAGVHGLRPKEYALVLPDPSGLLMDTAHAAMTGELLKAISEKITLLLPLDAVQGTTFEALAHDRPETMKVIDMPGPGDLLALLRDSAFLVTDIEELQAESTVMDVPCLTMMERTFRPSTIEIGTNVLVGDDADEMLARIDQILHPDSRSHRQVRSKIPEKWDGAAASRIVAVLDAVLQ